MSNKMINDSYIFWETFLATELHVISIEATNQSRENNAS